MSIEELADLVGVPIRTVRYYITEGLLPSPGTRGKGTVYGEDHLLRLRLIRMLVEQRVPLAEIREQLEGLSLPELRTILNRERRRVRETAKAAESPRVYISALLGRARSGPEGTQMLREAAEAEAGPQKEDYLQRPRWARGGEWQRWELAPGIELHVRADTLGQYGRLIEQLLQMARSFVSGQRQ